LTQEGARGRSAAGKKERRMYGWGFNKVIGFRRASRGEEGRGGWQTAEIPRINFAVTYSVVPERKPLPKFGKTKRVLGGGGGT